MLVRITQNIAGPDCDLRVGDQVEMGQAEAVRHIEAGHAVPAEPKIERAVKAPVETRAPAKRKK